METGDDVDDPLGHFTSHLDLNDNTHIIDQRNMENQHKRQTLTCHSDDNSLVRIVRRESLTNSTDQSSATSDSKQPGLLYSPEDNLNNDFFYDDEFAIQFDATLSGMEEAVMDSVDLSRLLNVASEDNQRWRSKMMASKSDSCLYQPELDFSSCSDPNATSSERELLTSSDMSDFKAEPLFSPPPPGELADSCMALQSDSICNEELAGSLMKDEDRYTFDWAANKDQYMISFDRSPTKISSESLDHEFLPKQKVPKFERDKVLQHVTRWKQGNSNDSNVQRVCSETSSGSQGTSGSGPCSMITSSNHPCSDTTSGNSLPPSPACVTISNGNNSSRLSSTDTSTSSTMTTWKLLRQNKGKGKLPEGMTTWKHIREGNMHNSVAQRSKSMPNLQSQQQKDGGFGGDDKSQPNLQEGARPKRYSTSLLEIYRQLKAQQGIVEPYREPPTMEPLPTREFELETWSMSAASSEQISPTEVTGKPLNGYAAQNNVPCGEENMHSPVPRGQSDVKELNRLDPCAPSLNDCGVQTSVEPCAKQSKEAKQNKSLQTSWELLTGAHIRIHRRQHRGYPNLARKVPHPHKIGSAYARKQCIDDKFTVHLTKQAKERMTRSLFFKSTILPDLSFLSRHMSYSTANLTQALYELPKDKKPVALIQPPVTIPDQSRHTQCSPAGYRPKKPPRQQRCHSVCLSREASPVVHSAKHRSRSTDSGSSFCSSSSSGIDPGSYESHRSLHYLNEHHSQQGDHPRDSGQEMKVICAKGRRSGELRGMPEGIWPPPDRRTVKVCELCQIRCEDVTREGQNMAASHPSYKKSNSEENFASWTSSECVHVAELYHSPSYCCMECAPCMCLFQELYSTHARDCPECHCFYLNRGCQHDRRSRRQNSKPLKSCLAKKQKADKKMLAFKRRSWSDPSDGLVLKYSQDGQIKYQLITHDKECKRRQPLSEIEVHENPSEPEAQLNQDQTEKASVTNMACCHCCQTDEGLEDTAKMANTVNFDEKQNIAAANSPEQIPVPPCTCGVTHAILHSSSESGGEIGQSCGDIYRSKKSVSFSEEISYHSPYNSPHQSPQRQVQPTFKDTGTGVVIRHPVGRHLSPKKRPVSLPPNFRLIIPAPTAQPIPEDPGCESPPKDFSVSPPVSVSQAAVCYENHDSLADKRCLVHDVMKATQILTNHFSKIRTTQNEPVLCDAENRIEMSHLVLDYLCPAVYAIIQDSLKPHVRSLFGKVKNTPWRVVEDSMDPAMSSQVIRNLVRDLKSLDFLTTAWLKFNAFVFGLLNNKALDLWFSQLHSNTQILQKHYELESFLLLTTIPSAKQLFLDLITTIQQLKTMPFHLDYSFEYRLLEARQQQQLAEQLLQKHVLQDGKTEHHVWLQCQKHSLSMEQLSQAGSLSPMRGELSPVQGEAGQPQGMLHHSAPADYQKQQMVVYSPTKAKWNSLYNKVQQLKSSDIAQQTKALVTESFKSLKDSTTLKLSKDALHHLGQDLVHAAVGYSSPVRALPSIPGLTGSGDDTAAKHSNSSNSSSTTVEKTSSQKAVSVLENNELIVCDQDESEENADKENLIQRVSQRLVGYNSPQKAYKQGVTEYRFCNKANIRPNSLGGSKSLDSLAKPGNVSRNVSLEQRKSLFDENGMPRCNSLDESIRFQIPSRPEGVSNPSTPPDQQECKSGNQHKSHARKLSKSLGTSLRKSWSSFGPKLVSFMDHLLLDDLKSKTSRKLSTATPSSSSTSSGSSSPPSVILRTDASKMVPTVRSVPSHPSAITGPCQSSTSPTDLHQIQDALESGKCGIVEIEDSAKTEAADVQKNVLPSTDASVQNWFVQTLCHHVAMQDDQLSFDKGTVFAVIRQVDSDWLLCRHGDKEGLVHTACVTSA